MSSTPSPKVEPSRELKDYSSTISSNSDKIRREERGRDYRDRDYDSRREYDSRSNRISEYDSKSNRSSEYDSRSHRSSDYYSKNKMNDRDRRDDGSFLYSRKRSRSRSPEDGRSRDYRSSRVYEGSHRRSGDYSPERPSSRRYDRSRSPSRRDDKDYRPPYQRRDDYSSSSANNGRLPPSGISYHQQQQQHQQPQLQRPLDYPQPAPPSIPVNSNYNPSHQYSRPPAPPAMPWRDSNTHYNPSGYVPYGGVGDNFGSFSNLHRPDWQSSNLVPFEKNFYREHPKVKARSEEEVRAFRERHMMTVFGHDIPKPVESFEEGCFPEYIDKMLKSQGFSSPTTIQCQVSSIGNFFLCLLANFYYCLLFL